MKRSGRTMGFSRRMLALLLCCVCLLMAVPGAAFALTEDEATEATVVETTVAPESDSENAPTGETTDPGQALYERLMACATVDEVNAILDSLSDEEAALVEQFTQEQNDALTAKMEALGGYDVDDLASPAALTVVQGGSAGSTLGMEHVVENPRIEKNGYWVSPAAYGITVTVSGTQVTIQTSESTPAGEYPIKIGFGGFTETITLTVTAKPASGTPDTPVTNTKQMTYDKTVTLDNETGKYNLELTLSGAVGTQENKAKVDLVIVIDNSNSMYDTGKTGKDQYDNNADRIKNARDAANSLISSLASNDKIDARYNIVAFGGNGGTSIENCTKSYGWTESSATASNNVEIISRKIQDDLGGTNYEAGLMQAEKQLGSARAGATTVVVFLTDGLPTFRVTSKEENIKGKKYPYGTGSSDDSGYNLKAATDYAKKMTMDRFYVVGFGDADKENMEALANAATNASVKKYYYYDGSGNDLTTIFNNIATDIQTFLCDHVTITDTLSKYVQLTDGSTVKVKVLKSDGTVVAVPADSVNLDKTSTNGAATLTASYDKEKKTLKLDFPDDYKLEPDYTYVLCAEIEPTETAYEKYRNGGYTDIGDADTGTHSGEFGFYSNDKAWVDYKYNGSPGSVEYDMPVVQLNPGKLVITKTFEGLTGVQIESLKQSLKFSIKLVYPQSTGEKTVTVPLSEFTNTNGTYTYTIEGLSPNTSYTVTETGGEVSGMNWTKTVTGSESGTVSRGGTANVSYKNSYEVSTVTLTVTKKISGNMLSQNDEFHFTVTGSSVKGADESFTLKDGGSKTITVNKGDTITVTEDKGNYTTTYKIGDETKNGIEAEITADSNLTITFTNEYNVLIETGILLDTLPYVVILAVVAVGAVLLLHRGRKRDEA